MNSYKLRDLITIKNGTKYDHLSSGEIPVYGTGGIMTYVDKFLYEGEAILLPRKGSLKNIMYTNGRIWTVDTLYYAVVNKKASAYYLYYYLKQLDLSRLDSGSALPSMTSSAYYNLEISLPELPLQQRIAEILSALDEKIKINDQINTELEQMAKTLYDYWFVQFDFPNAKGKPFKSSRGKMVFDKVLKREVPEGWEVRKLGQTLKTHLGGTPSTANKNFWDGDIPWMNSGEVANFPLISTEQRITQNAVDNSSTKYLRKGSVLLSITRHLRVNILGIDACINQSIAGVEENELFKSSYIYFSILNDIERLMSLRTGAQQPHINKEIVDDSPFVVPDEKILEQYYKRATPIIERIINNANQNQELIALRDWLLPMLMNGQVKVRQSAISDMADGSMVVKSKVSYGKTGPLKIPANKKAFAKQVLAGKIVSTFKGDPNFTEIKFQKVQYLAEHLIEADLNLNYYYQAAGPYDNKFMHSIYTDFRKQKWFDYKNKQFIPLEKQEKIEGYYQGYFAPARMQLDNLFDILYQLTEAEVEIVATLYAIWNNRIIEKRQSKDEELIAEFYQWSDRKQRYSKSQIESGLEFLRNNLLEPTGFGELIKRAKYKN